MSRAGRGRLLAAAAGAALWAAAAPASAPPDHNQLFFGQWVHAPLADDDCGVCHTIHGEAVGPALQADEPDLCYQCHEDVSTKDIVHEPVGAGRCSDCHRVHTSDVRPLLLRRIPDLCIECHPPTPSHVGRGMVCTQCHGVHSSETSRFLKDERNRPCKRCHESKQRGERVHEPARTGKCLTCHFTHPDPRFGTEKLRGRYTMRVRGTYSPGDFGLCERCHDRRLFEDVDWLETWFRTGTRNLHALHVAAGGVSCSSCHDVHSSGRPSLVAGWFRQPDKAPRQIQFLRFSTGGSCGPACHAVATYLRDEEAEFAPDEYESSRRGRSR